MWNRLLCVLTLWLLAACAQAQATAVRLEPHLDEVKLAGHIEWLEDASRQMTLAQVRSSPEWRLLPGMPNAGYTGSAIWLRLRLAQPPAPVPEWRLELEIVQLDELRLYSPAPDGSWLEQRTGRFLPHDQWPLQSRVPALRLALPPGQHEIYLRLQGEHTLSGDLRLLSVERFRERSVLEALTLGVFFGILGVVVILQLFYWLAVREKASGWYLLYTLVLLGGMSLNAGYPQNFFNLTTQSTLHLIGIYLCLAPAVIFRLTVVWLDLDRQLPRISWLFQFAVYSTALVTAVLTATGDYVRGASTSQSLTLLWVLLEFALGMWMWRRRQPHAGSYLLIFSFIDIGILTRFARNLGLLPVSFWTDYALFIGVALHMVAMSLHFIHRYNALRSSLEIEQRAREEQREFVGLVSHEFRTPLAIINTSIQQLSANLDAPTEKSQQRAQNIRQAVQRMNLLLDDYLSLDRLDTTQQPVRLRPCDFFEVVEEAASDWPLEQIQVQVRDLPARFVCDPDLMRIVLRNLLANAVRHSPPGTAVLLDVAGTRQGGLYIRVRDHGEGIPADELPRIFQKYFRGRGARGTPGAGLGLHLVQRIVHGHGGTIDAQSTPSQGTTFSIFLPGNAQA